MWTLFKSQLVSRVVVDGRVSCPIQATDNDVELCLGCPSLADVSEDRDGLLVRCRKPVLTNSLP